MSDTPVTLTDAELEQLRADAETGRSAATKSANYEREIAFLRAGVDTSKTLGEMVMRKHTGDDLTPEAIRETEKAIRVELGLAVDEGAGTLTPEQQATNARDLLQGGRPAGNEPPAPKTAEQEARSWYEQARAAGHSVEDSQVVGIGSLIRSGATGDKDVVYDADAFGELARQHGHGAEFSGLPDARVG